MRLFKEPHRLSSGSRITQPADDAGEYEVSMKLRRHNPMNTTVEKNIDNAISFSTSPRRRTRVGKILDRMSLKLLVKMC